VQGVLVAEQHRENVERKRVLAGLARAPLTNELVPTGDRWCQKLGLETTHRLTDLRLHFVGIAKGVGKGCALDELHHVRVQPVGFLGCSERAVDPGIQRCEIHHQLVRQMDEFDRAVADVRCERVVDDAGEIVALVAHQCFATEQPVLESAPRAMFVAVEIDEHAPHDDFTRVVERLAQIFLSVDVSRVFV